MITESQTWPSEITPDQLVRWLDDHHHTTEDLSEGDLNDRVWSYRRYTLELISLDGLDLTEFWVDPDMVSEYSDMTDAPPIIYDPVNNSIIDGTHRANARKESGHKDILAYVGDATTYEEPDGSE